MLINETNSKEIIKSLEYLINLSEKDYSNMSFNCRKLAKDIFDVKIILMFFLNISSNNFPKIIASTMLVT